VFKSCSTFVYSFASGKHLTLNQDRYGLAVSNPGECQLKQQ